jgi:hypothetical protein
MRIVVATLIGLAAFALYVMGAVALADLVAPLHWIIQLAYFVLAGVLWVLPAKWLMYWAARR